MQKYKIVFSDVADDDLEEIIVYLSNFSQNIALRYYDEIMQKANSLIFMPERCPFVNDDEFRVAGYHWLFVRNYIIFYIVNNFSHTVQIRRILHSSRDYTALL